MKKGILYIILCLTGLPFAKAQQNQKFVPTVLVEFYTSEGCGSCPQADDFATEIGRRADSLKMPVYTLDFHVDLWNQSGWVDPFSDSMFTKRQYAMALANNQKAMFTPMVFVNGQGALPAGARGETGKLIEKHMTKPADRFLLFTASWAGASNTMVFDYEIKGNTDSCSVYFAFAEKLIFNVPTGGENAGKKLSHHNVVRKLVRADQTTAMGSVSLPFASAQIDFSKYVVIGFLQHKRTGAILAAQRLDFKAE